jgi:hypothetical protein
MRSSTVINLIGLGAGLASSSPIDKRDGAVRARADAVTVYQIPDGDLAGPAPPTVTVTEPADQAAGSPITTVTTTLQPGETPKTAPLGEVNTPSGDQPPAASPSSSGSLPAATDYESTVLYWHNVHRRNHGADDLVYDDALASSAATLAAKCVFAHDL